MVADLIRALLAGAAGAVLPGYFWAAVLRPAGGLGERLAWSTGISMASVPTVAVILARVSRGGIALWVALASVLIVFGSGLLVYWLRGPAPGTAAPVLRMPEPTRDPRVLGLVAVAIALGLLMMTARRPPVLVLAVIAVALIAGGAPDGVASARRVAGLPTGAVRGNSGVPVGAATGSGARIRGVGRFGGASGIRTRRGRAR